MPLTDYGGRSLGDEDAWERFQRSSPDTPIAYDPFQKLLAITAVKAMGDATAYRWLFPDTHHGNKTAARETGVEQFTTWLDNSDLHLPEALRVFLRTYYRDVFDIKATLVSIPEQLRRLFARPPREVMGSAFVEEEKQPPGLPS